MKGNFPYVPELVGNTVRLFIGKKSGRHSVLMLLEEMGLEATPKQIKEILTIAKNKSTQLKRVLTKDECAAMVKQLLDENENPNPHTHRNCLNAMSCSVDSTLLYRVEVSQFVSQFIKEGVSGQKCQLILF